MRVVANLLTPNRGGRPGRKITPKGVVIHWTGDTNKGADAMANRHYFETHPQDKVSAHYVVDDKMAVMCIPETEMAYHVYAERYRYKSGVIDKLSAYPNGCTLAVEICVNSDGNLDMAIKNAVELVANICQRHGWTSADLWRHYDITGKDCPRFFVDDTLAWAMIKQAALQGWNKFKADVDLALQRLRSSENGVRIVYGTKAAGGVLQEGKSWALVTDILTLLGYGWGWDGKTRTVTAIGPP